jgi:hypothetical protein
MEALSEGNVVVDVYISRNFQEAGLSLFERSNCYMFRAKNHLRYLKRIVENTAFLSTATVGIDFLA